MTEEEVAAIIEEVDENGDGIPDVCVCPIDLDDSGVVDFADLLLVLAAWGRCGVCIEDIDKDGIVDFNDLLIVLSNWGLCPD